MVQNNIENKKSKKVKLSYNEKQELTQLEETIPLLEKKIKDIDLQLNDVTDFLTIQELVQQREELSHQLDESSIRWLELLEKEA